MRVFVTGASGTIGKAVTKELLSHGHQVLGLVRSDAGADELKSLGAEVQHGTLTDVDILRKAASECDGVAHLAFIHDLEDYDGCCAIDRAAIEAMGSALAEAGGNRAFVISSGTMLLTKGQVGTEDQKYDARDSFGAIRGPSESVALAFAGKGVRVSVMRLPSVYGEGGLGFVALMIRGGKVKGKSRAGSVFHPVADEGVRTKDIAEVLGKKLNVPIVAMSQEEALETFGPMIVAMGADNPSSSAKTREQLGWTPVQPSLLEDMESGTCLERQTALPSWSLWARN
ncbi:hypothetical protein CIB48_g146 [Xylaria polymorpha]|nr:hypothetical protein CIB48_g146 [Xylaria polymorpha]